MPQRTESAERILRAAMRLFAVRGYDQTSIADIQAEAGLAPGSGAMYKHFPSKEAVLHAGLESFIAEAERGRDAIRQFPPESANALELLASGVLDSFARDRDMVRIVWRDLDRFPKLQERVREQRIQATFPVLARWLEGQTKLGHFREHDSAATAAVLLSSLVMYGVFDAVMGAALGKVSKHRFLRAWIELARHGLDPRQGASGKRGNGGGRSPTSTPGNKPAHTTRARGRGSSLRRHRR